MTWSLQFLPHFYKDGTSKQRERIISVPDDKPYSEN